MLWYQKLYSELLHRLWVSMMMMMMLSDKGFWLDHDQIEDSKGVVYCCLPKRLSISCYLSFLTTGLYNS